VEKGLNAISKEYKTKFPLFYTLRLYVFGLVLLINGIIP
jgi:hypothetical protein